ncbi:hypothetical protein [Actinomadura fibrosa]|uniref:Uncharacterized protein n=1 Tax=Actinomadura fibrosa TaxID=111802 RepID=A0ABW2XKQ1_9ACTN|nr:hypothetical protein [Actinomadura fibrosa]
MGQVDTQACALLAALNNRLEVYRLDTVLEGCSLVVLNPHAIGCCEQVHRPADRITCRRRGDDGGRWWFWTSWGQPIAEADRVVDAAVIIAGYLRASSG